MGEIADGMIDGTFDSMTGEYLGEGPGYPRTFANRPARTSNYKKTVYGIMLGKGNKSNISHIQIDLIVKLYVIGILKLSPNIKITTAYKHITLHEQEFIEWYKKHYPHFSTHLK